MRTLLARLHDHRLMLVVGLAVVIHMFYYIVFCNSCTCIQNLYTLHGFNEQLCKHVSNYVVDMSTHQELCMVQMDKLYDSFSLPSGTGHSIRSNSSTSPADLHGMWYPTVRRTLVCLSKLYRCIDVSLRISPPYLVYDCVGLNLRQTNGRLVEFCWFLYCFNFYIAKRLISDHARSDIVIKEPMK